MIRAWPWLQQWLADVRTRRLDNRVPVALRSCAWCQNGLHTTCRGVAMRPNLTAMQCRCPCPTAAGHRAP